MSRCTTLLQVTSWARFTQVSGDGLTLGHIDDVLDQLNQDEAVLDRADPDLVHEVGNAIAHWDSRLTTRLVELLPLLDRLAEITGATLPPLLPPSK